MLKACLILKAVAKLESAGFFKQILLDVTFVSVVFRDNETEIIFLLLIFVDTACPISCSAKLQIFGPKWDWD